MTLNTKLAFLLSMLFAGSAFAQGAPGTISFVARLADAGNPITGTHNLDVALFDAATGGTAIWTESRTGITIPSDGILYLDLGSVTPLDASVFSGGKKYLEVTIDAQITTPRIVIESTPYAIRSGEASHAGDSDTLGTHPASFYQARVSNACSSGTAIAAIDATGSVTCQPIPAYLAGAGILLTGTTFSVDTGAIQARVAGVCNTGAIESVNANGTVGCATAGTGLAFSTNQFTVDFATTQHAIAPCTAGSLLAKTDSSGNASCYAPGFGIQFTGGSQSWDVNPATVQKRVTGTCASGAVTAIAQDGSVTCGGGSPAFGAAAGTVTTMSTSYAANGGPTATATIGSSGNAMVTISGGITPTSGKLAYMGLAVDTGTATDNQALIADTNFIQASATYVVTGLTAGSHTFTVEYRTNGGAAASFTNRTIIVTPL